MAELPARQSEGGLLLEFVSVGSYSSDLHGRVRHDCHRVDVMAMPTASDSPELPS